jgi:hypothetical protein
MSDNSAVEDQPGYTSVLQRELEGLVDAFSSSRVRRSVGGKSNENAVSNAAGDVTKLQ